jgi:hypothetical protein
VALGAENEPLAPLKNPTFWTFPPLPCSLTSQVRAPAGKLPSSASSAWPEKLITSPTFQVKLGEGVSMTAAGASPTVMSTDSVSVAPSLSATLSPTE